MLYLRKLFTQDLRDGKQIAFPKEPSLSFFHYDYIIGEADRQIQFIFNAEFSEYIQYNGLTINTRLYTTKSESRIDGELKAFIRDQLNAKVDDILCFTEISRDKYEFKFIQQGSHMYPLFLSFINSKNHTVVCISDKDESSSHHSLENEPLQQIFYGAPGTGKSHGVKEVTDKVASEFVFRTTFHPDSDYSTFVGAYKPTMTKKAVRNVAGDIVKESGVEVYEPSIVYTFVPQAFLKAYVAAWKNNETEQKVFLVIEEINRGNCAQIFGDIFQLLDRKGNGESEYPINADQDIQNYLAEAFADCNNLPKNILSGEELVLPANLHIWATMNTSDQSLFPIDSAFKRRWDWKYMPIHDAGENWTIALSDVEYDWWDFVEKINNVIGNMTSSEDKKLGYFFCKACNGKIDAEKFVNKVVFYLWNDVFKDYELSDKAFQDGEGKLTFNKFYTPSGDANESTIKTLMENMGVSTSDLISEIDEEAVNLSKDDLSALQQKRLNFWTNYLEYAHNNADYMQHFSGRQTPTKNHYYKYQVFPNTNGSLCVVIKHKANKLFVKFETTDEQLYNGLYLHKDAIQSELGDINLTWEGKVGTRARIDIYAEHDVDFNNEQNIFNLIIDRLLRMREVFDKYLNN